MVSVQSPLTGGTSGGRPHWWLALHSQEAMSLGKEEGKPGAHMHWAEERGVYSPTTPGRPGKSRMVTKDTPHPGKERPCDRSEAAVSR